MKKTFIKTKNVKNFITMMNNLQNRAEGVPGMALVYGEPGLGKTQAILWWAAQNNAVYIRSTNLMSGRWLLEELAEGLGEMPYYRFSNLFKQVITQLLSEPRVIIIDEVDYLASDAKTIETLRDIHDKTNTPIILVGMGRADKKLMRYKHLFDRISEIVKFEPFKEQDVKDIITQLCEIEISDCGVKFIYSQTSRFRQIVKMVNKAEQLAKSNNLSLLDEITLKEFINYEPDKKN